MVSFCGGTFGKTILLVVIFLPGITVVSFVGLIDLVKGVIFEEACVFHIVLVKD